MKFHHPLFVSLVFCLATAFPLVSLAAAESTVDIARKEAVVAIRGQLPPNAPKGEQALFNLLGQMPGIRSILIATNAKDFFDTLARYTNPTDGYKIPYLIIQGHGNADNPHINLSPILHDGDEGSQGVRPEDIDYPGALDLIRQQKKLLDVAKRDMAELQLKPDQADIDIQRGVLENSTHNSTEKIKEGMELLERLESVSQAMSPGGRILLLNCSAYAKKGGKQFVHRLGQILLGRGGGQLAASTTDLAVLETGGEWVYDGIFNWLWTFFRYGRIAKPGDIEVSGTGWFGDRLEWVVLNFPVNERQVLNSWLKVEFDPYIVETTPGAKVELTPKVKTYGDSGRLRYSWLWSGGASTAAKASVELPQAVQGLIEVTVLVMDERSREGTAAVYLVVRPECRYRYSEWGACDAATGRRQRSLLGKEPAHCVEKNPPELDQGCATPTQGVQAEGAERFSGTAPGNWTGGNNDKGFHFKRSEVSGGGKPKDCVGEAKVNAEVYGVLSPSFAPATKEAIKTKLEAEYADMKRYLAFRGGEVAPYAISGFQGYLLQSRQLKGGTGSPQTGYTDLTVLAAGHGYVTKEGKTAEVTYVVTSGGCWNRSQQAFQEAEVAKAQAEVYAILAGLQLVADGQFVQGALPVSPAIAGSTPASTPQQQSNEPSVTEGKKVEGADDANKKIIQAKAEWDQGDVAKAMSTFNQAKTLAPKDPEVKSTVDAYATKKDRIDASMKQAREQARLGKLDDAIAEASRAIQENPKNQEVIKYIATVKQVKAKTDTSLERVGQLIAASEFKQAQAALIPIKNAFPYYPPVQEMDRRLGDEWQKWDSQVKATLEQVSMAVERRDFKEALELIEKTRNTLKLLPSYLQQLADKEGYCKQMEARKEEARRLFKSGETKLRNCDYDGAIADFTKGFAVSENLWNINKDDTRNHAEKLAAEAHEKKKQLEAHLQIIREASKLEPHPARIKDFENGLQHCGEARMLQTQNSSLPRYEAELQSKLRLAGLAQTAEKNPDPQTGGKSQVAGAAAAKSDSSILAGKWSLNANNFPGTLEFQGHDANLQGVLTIGGNENLRDVRFNGTILTFTRPIIGATQVYTGRLSRSSDGKLHLEGTFSQESDRSDYKWFADLTDAVPIQQTTPTVQPENHAVQQGANIGGIRIKASSFPNLTGQWKCKKYCPAGAEGGYAIIKQGESRQLHFTNEGGGTSEGRFVDQNTVIATQWGDLRGVIKEGGRSIHWDNGTVWERR